jgi:hypothetical protein
MTQTKEESFNYIIDSFERAKEKNNIEILNIAKKYMYNYVVGNYDPCHKEYFMKWITENYFKNWQYVVEEMDINELYNFISEIFKNFIKAKDEKFKNIHDIFKNKCVKDLLPKLINTKIVSGINEEKNGFFCWIKTENNLINYDKLYNSCIPLVENRIIFKMLLRYIHNLLDYNTAYTQSYIIVNEIKKCC